MEQMITNPNPTVFDRAIAHCDKADSELKGSLKSIVVRSAIMPNSSTMISFNRPTHVIVSRHAHGYRVTDVYGADAEEALGFMLAQDLTSADALFSFQKTLANPAIAPEIVNRLLTRKGVPVKRGVYAISQKTVAKVVKAVLGDFGESRASILGAYNHVMMKTLTHLKLVLPSLNSKIVRTSADFAINGEDMRKLVLVESMRDLFNAARLNEVTRRLDQDATPDVIGEVIQDVLRHTATAIPEITLRMRQVGLVELLINKFYVDPRSLSEVMQAHTSLQTLASYANFAVQSSQNVIGALITADNSDLKQACDNILTLLNSAPSIETISLTQFSDHFGVVPASNSGLYRGLIMYKALHQVTQMDVVQYTREADGGILNLQPSEYTPFSRLAADLNRTVLTPGAMEGLANIVADELSLQPFRIGDDPQLLTIGVTDADMMYIAMAKAKSMSFVANMSSGPSLPQLVFAVDVAEQYIMNVGAATPGVAFFDDPNAVIVYQFGDNHCDPTSHQPKPLPSRNQSLALGVLQDAMFVGSIEDRLSKEVNKIFKAKLPIALASPSGELTELIINISPLPVLMPILDSDGRTNPAVSDDSFFASINEPGVDNEIKLMLAMISLYAASGDLVQSDRAKSWIIETLGEAMKNHEIIANATMAINQAIVATRLDARRLRAQFKDVMVLAYFSTLIGVLARFNKVQPDVAADLIGQVPVSGLSIKAAAILMSMPVRLNASQLTGGN